MLRPKTPRTLALAWLVIALAALSSVASAAPNEVAVGETLRDAVMRGLNGPTRKLSDFLGRPLIINVWASWCGPCRSEMASLERLAWLDPSAPYTIIGISTDDYREKAEAALKASNATITHFIDRNLELEHMLGASRLPLTVLVDADGTVLKKVYGAREWDGPEALALIDAAFELQPRSDPATR